MSAKIPNTYRRKNGIYYVCFRWPAELCKHFNLANPLIRFSTSTANETEARCRSAIVRSNYYMLIGELSDLLYNGASLSNPSRFLTYVILYLRSQKQEYLNMVMKEFEYPNVATNSSSTPEESSSADAVEVTTVTSKQRNPLPAGAVEVTTVTSKQRNPLSTDAVEVTTVISKQRNSLPTDSPDNKIIIEDFPDGRRKKYSDLTDPVAANAELFQFEQMCAQLGGTGGGGSSLGGPSVDTVAAQFKEEKKRDDWSNPKTYSIRVCRLERVVGWLGRNKDITSLKRKDILEVRKKIRSLYEPDRKRRSPKDGKMSLHTAKSHMQICKALFAYASDEDIIETNIAADVFLKLSGSSTSKLSYLPYMKEEVAAMLNGYVYNLQELPRQRDLIDAFFWQPFIAMFSGARVGELCQLTIGDINVRDVVDSNGHLKDRIWYFWLNDEELAQALKTESSRREVPIHSAILKAGFLEFVALRKQEEKGNLTKPLFLSPDKSKDVNATRAVGRWFNGETGFKGYLDNFSIKNRDRKCFHSFRHTCVKALRSQHFDNEAIAATVGHEPNSMTGKYGDGFELETLKEIIEHIDYGVNLSHIHFANYLPYQQCKGQPIKNQHLAIARTKRTLPEV